MNGEEGEGKAFRRKKESRERIVEAASGLFIERGAKSVSMDEVAEESGVARRTLFNYFAGKDDLLWAVASPMLESATSIAEARLGEKGAGLDGVLGLCLDLWRAWGRRLSLLYSVDLADNGRLAALHGSFLSRFRKLVDEAIAEEPSFAAERRLVGRVIYRNFVPLLLALDGASPEGVAFPGPAGEGRAGGLAEPPVPGGQGNAPARANPEPAPGGQGLEERFVAGMKGLLSGVARLG